MGLFEGKKGLVFGIANDYSIAWAITKKVHAEGADIGFTHLPDKLGAYKTGLLAFCLALAGVSIIAVAPNWEIGMIGGVVCGFAWSLLFPALGLMAVDRTPRAQRNSALAIYTAGFDLGTLVAGFTLGYIASAAGYETVYAFGAAFAIVGLILVYTMRPTRDAVVPSA